MILISYDISNTKLRTKFAKFITKYGIRIQYSVFEITNSKRLLSNIMSEIKYTFEDKFEESDSVIIIETSENCKITKYGYPKHEESDIIILD